MLRPIAFALAGLITVACNGNGGPATSAPQPSRCAEHDSPAEVEFETGRALLDTGDDSVIIGVEIADSPEEHSLGLMNRPSLPEDCGMAFLFFQETSGGFWMKDTLIPLSIAFFDQDGTIVDILDMEPCRQDPCEIYEPSAPYWGALEVNQGAFDTWGIDEGDRISIPS